MCPRIAEVEFRRSFFGGEFHWRFNGGAKWITQLTDIFPVGMVSGSTITRAAGDFVLQRGRAQLSAETPGLSRITDEEMKKLMSEASAKLTQLLALEESDPEKYWLRIRFFNQAYCKNWEK